jgi:hypothetical protein
MSHMLVLGACQCRPLLGKEVNFGKKGEYGVVNEETWTKEM